MEQCCQIPEILCNHSRCAAFQSMTTSKPAMFKTLILIFTFLSILPACAQIGGSLRERIAQRIQSAAEPGGEEMSYGSDPLQKLDYWKPSTPGSPMVIYVHGGGWKRGDKRMASGEKGTHFVQQGYAFASLNYRLVPACTVEEQAQDVANGIAYLIRNAEKLGFDGKRVALIGHSAGAHLVALVGTDLSYLKIAEVGPKAVRGVIPLDGAAYDVARQLPKAATSCMRPTCKPLAPIRSARKSYLRQCRPPRRMHRLSSFFTSSVWTAPPSRSRLEKPCAKRALLRRSKALRGADFRDTPRSITGWEILPTPRRLWWMRG